MTTVYHLPNSKPSSSGGWQVRPSQPYAYHADPSCQYISGKDRITTASKDSAEKRGLEPCSVCVQDDDVDTSWQTTECPLCGGTIDKQLALHIRQDCTAK